MGKKEKRFLLILNESGRQIWKDTETGVLYFCFITVYGGAMTLLVDQNGKPLIDPASDSAGSNKPCTKCGKPQADGNKFCTQCGSALPSK